MFDISKKHILITGGGSGLGAHFAACLASKGANVTITGRRAAPLRNVAEKLRASAGEVATIQMDVTEPESVTKAFSQAEQTYG